MSNNTLESVWETARANHADYSTMDTAEADEQFLALALCGEAGELANFVKKEWRDGADYGADKRKEVADVCAYAFMFAARIGMTPQDLLDTVAEKQDVFRDKMVALAQSRITR